MTKLKTVKELTGKIDAWGEIETGHIIELLTQDRATILAVLRHKVDGMQLINKGETEDTPVCDNESCSAFNAYNQALKDVEVLLQETLGVK